MYQICMTITTYFNYKLYCMFLLTNCTLMVPCCTSCVFIFSNLEFLCDYYIFMYDIIYTQSAFILPTLFYYETLFNSAILCNSIYHNNSIIIMSYLLDYVYIYYGLFDFIDLYGYMLELTEICPVFSYFMCYFSLLMYPQAVLNIQAAMATFLLTYLNVYNYFFIFNNFAITKYFYSILVSSLYFDMLINSLLMSICVYYENCASICIFLMNFLPVYQNCFDFINFYVISYGFSCFNIFFEIFKLTNEYLYTISFFVIHATSVLSQNILSIFIQSIDCFYISDYVINMTSIISTKCYLNAYISVFANFSFPPFIAMPFSFYCSILVGVKLVLLLCACLL